MPKQTIEFVIRPDGTVEERPKGFRGAECEDVTRRIEQKLGRVSSRQPTSERYDTPESTSDGQVENRGR